jgi:hypothetical protein
MRRPQHGTEIPDDVDSSAGKPVAAGGWYIFAVVIFALVALAPAVARWIGGLL